MLKKFKMEDCKPMSTPMITSCKLSKEDESEELDQQLASHMALRLLHIVDYQSLTCKAFDKILQIHLPCLDYNR